MTEKKISLHVLIVEDSNDDALLIGHELKTAGFQVFSERVQTADGLEQALVAKKWDIVLSDYSMPQFTAIDVLKILKEKNPDLPCIVISGTIGEETAVAAMKAGAQDFFVKGRLNRLPSAVKRQLTEAENARQKRKTELELREAELHLAKEREESLIQQTAAREKIEGLYHQAQEANRLKEEFLATLSHELRTPMTAITGWSSLLFSGECPTEDYPIAFSTIYRNAQAQNKLINDVLDLSKVLSGKLLVENAPVNLIDVTKAAIESVRLSLEAKEIYLKTSMDPSTGPVPGDSHRLQQIIWNILSNSIKFTPKGGSITVDIRPAGNRAELRILDTGDGIDAHFLPFVFDRFRQADGSLTRRYGGLGLGLAIVHHLVEIHGGQIEATSDGLGKGTMILVRFPMMTKHPESFSKDFSKSANKLDVQIDRQREILKGLRVLVVDDCPDNCILLKMLLKRHGAEVIIADSARRAFQLFNENHLDILLCDIEMPEENGYEFIRRLRASGSRGAKLPAAAVTAHVRSEDIAQAMKAGFQQHISKPIQESILIFSVAQLAATHRKEVSMLTDNLSHP